MIRRHVAQPNSGPFRLKGPAQSKLAGWPINGLVAHGPFIGKARLNSVKSARHQPVVDFSSLRPMVTSGPLTIHFEFGPNYGQLCFWPV